MKKIFLILLALLIPVVIFSVYSAKTVHAAAANSACLSITGKFTASNWKGGTMMVGCDGDAGPNCPGQIIKNLIPGKSYTLTKCSCPPYADGCLKVGQQLKLVKNSAGRPRITVVGNRLPKSCSISKINNICGTNGNVIKGNFKISCTVPPVTITPTPTTGITPVITPTPTPGITPVITPTPTPGICKGPAPVAHVTVTCPTCSSNGPTPTPTPTPIVTATSCGDSTDPLLEVVGPSTQTIGTASETTSTFSLKLINCGGSFQNSLNLFSEFNNTGNQEGWTETFNPNDNPIILGKGESKTIKVIMKSPPFNDNTSGMSMTANYYATGQIPEGGSDIQSNTVILKTTLQ